MATTALWKWGEDIEFEAPVRAVDSVWIHCSASELKSWDDVSAIRNDHINNRGWADCGYHLYITKAGNIQPGRPLSKIPAAQQGYNKGAIAICCHGLKEAKFTSKQFDSLIKLCKAIQDAYPKRTLRFRGHREVAAKACPVFNYKKVLGLNANGNLGGPTTSYPGTGASAPPSTGSGSTRPVGVLQPVDRGNAVSVAQNLLVVNGVSCGADGIYGQQTAAAVRKFQGKVSLPVKGTVDERTRAALGRGAPGVADLERGSRGAAVEAFQRIMRLHGITVSADGAFGPLTEKAVKSFQSKNSVPQSGKVDRKTREASFKG